MRKAGKKNTNYFLGAPKTHLVYVIDEVDKYQIDGILSPYRKLFSSRFSMHVPVGLIMVIAGLVIVTQSSNHKGRVIVLV